MIISLVHKSRKQSEPLSSLGFIAVTTTRHSSATQPLQPRATLQPFWELNLGPPFVSFWAWYLGHFVRQQNHFFKKISHYCGSVIVNRGVIAFGQQFLLAAESPVSAAQMLYWWPVVSGLLLGGQPRLAASQGDDSQGNIIIFPTSVPICNVSLKTGDH